MSRVESWAEMILTKMSSYRRAEETTRTPPPSIIGRAIGVYSAEGTYDGVIWISEDGIVVLDGDLRRFVAFTEIAKVHLPKTKEELDEPTKRVIRVEALDGTLTPVVVAGSKGRFFDVFEFSRFLSRVVGLAKKAP